MRAFILVSVLASASFGAYKLNTNHDLFELQKELMAAGCVVDSLEAHGNEIIVKGDACAAAVSVASSHNPNTRKTARTNDRDRARALRDKVVGRSATSAEKDELLALLVKVAWPE